MTFLNLYLIMTMEVEKGQESNLFCSVTLLPAEFWL